jgi:general secretion pathway protein D
LEQQDTQSLTGIPGLAQIPILKYFFAQKNSEVTDTEVVFAVIPHIVRRKDLDEFNTRTVDVGTATGIRLRHASSAREASLSADKADSTGGAQSTSGAAALLVDPSTQSVPKGGTFLVNIVLSEAADVHSVPLQVGYDPHAVQLVNISNGDFLSRGEQVVALVHREDPLKGTVEITASRPPKSAGVSGHGVVTTLTFQASAAGTFPIRVTGAVIQSDQQRIEASGSEASVSVR